MHNEYLLVWEMSRKSVVPWCVHTAHTWQLRSTKNMTAKHKGHIGEKAVLSLDHGHIKDGFVMIPGVMLPLQDM